VFLLAKNFQQHIPQFVLLKKEVLLGVKVVGFSVKLKGISMFA